MTVNRDNILVKLVGTLMLVVIFGLSVQAQENIQFSQGKVEEGMSNSLGIPAWQISRSRAYFAGIPQLFIEYLAHR